MTEPARHVVLIVEDGSAEGAIQASLGWPVHLVCTDVSLPGRWMDWHWFAGFHDHYPHVVTVVTSVATGNPEALFKAKTTCEPDLVFLKPASPE